MHLEYTPQSIVICLLISLFILFRMTDRFIKWGRLCVADNEE